MQIIESVLYKYYFFPRFHIKICQHNILTFLTEFSLLVNDKIYISHHNANSENTYKKWATYGRYPHVCEVLSREQTDMDGK